MRLLVAALLSTVLTACATQPSGPSASNCHQATHQEVSGLFDTWNAALQTRQPKAVVKLYAPDSILLPTMSNTPRLTSAQKEDYFQHFMAKNPSGKIDQRYIAIECNVAVDSGLYTFSFNDGTSVPARYTYTYHWDGDQWLITSHHSSQMPEPL